MKSSGGHNLLRGLHLLVVEGHGSVSWILADCDPCKSYTAIENG